MNVKSQRKTTILAFAALCFASLSAPINAKTVWEIKLGAGLVSNSIDEGAVKTVLADATGFAVDTLSFSESSSNYAFSFLFRLEDSVFIESGYQNLGDLSLSLNSAVTDPAAVEAALLEALPGSGSGYYLGGGYEYQIGEKLWAVFNGGLIDWESTVDAKGNNFTQTVSVKGSGTDPYVGLGIAYKWYLDSAIYFDLKRYSMNNNSPITASVGVSIKF